MPDPPPPPDSALVAVAKAVVAELNATTFSEAFTAQRRYDGELELAAAGTLAVDVSPAGVRGAMLTRGSDEERIEISVWVRQKGDVGDPAFVDGLIRLCEEIRDHFLRWRMAGEPRAACVDWQQEPAYYPTHIRKFRQFTAEITLGFLLHR